MNAKFSQQITQAGFYQKFFLCMTALILGLGISYKTTHASANFSDIQEPLQPAVPQELTDEENQKQIEEIYAKYEQGFVIITDLADANGISPDLLPDDIAALIDSDTKIVAYRETVRSTTASMFSLSSCNSILSNLFMGISCKAYDGTQDVTKSKIFGGIEQFNRVYALRYDEYPGCGGAGNCIGWEFEFQKSKWTRTSSSWTVGSSSAKMNTSSSSAENFCTQASVNLNYSSSWFTPTFSGNSTNWWSISGYPNIAYVPFPQALSYTQGDLYQNGTLKYDNAQTTQTHNHLP